MAKTNYLPRADKDRAVWLNNFAGKFSTNAIALGFVAADVTSVTNDDTMFTYLINLVETFTTAKEQRVDYKNLIKDGPLGQVAGAFPVAPSVPAAPTAVAAGIFPRIAQLVQRIKNSPTYTDAIGKDLGIIGAEQLTDFTVMKPALKLVYRGGQVEVQWTKGDANAIHIEADRGTGTWQFLAIDTVPNYTDTTPITAAANWKYRAMYLVNDALVGQWSDVATITVG
jgi:hypothetical protein